ncbi:hypothetical protein [Actinocorallia aurea]
MRANGFDNVRAVLCAVSDEPGRLTFHLADPENVGTTSMVAPPHRRIRHSRPTPARSPTSSSTLS